MISRERRVVAVVLLLVGTARPITAQVAHFDAGGGAGGSVLGWQPRVALSGDMHAVSLGSFEASLRGSLARINPTSASLLQLTTGARLALGNQTSGWWVGGDAVRRNGFRDALERPRVETGGWHRIGNVVITLSAARRSARITGLASNKRQVTTWDVHYDTLTGGWDSSQVARTVGDSSRITASDRWAETEAGLVWEGNRLSTTLTLGGRLASRGVPRVAWASADVSVKLVDPVSVVLGAGNAAGSRFALDAEHRYLSLGVRLTPRSRHEAAIEHPLIIAAVVTSFAVDRAGDGRYRLALSAPRAHGVEISGDFTAWRPVALARDVADRWVLVTALTPGTHRLNVRVDNGPWVAPPGLTTMSDDFAGEVGLLVIEREHESK